VKTDNKYTTREYLDRNPTWHIEDSPWKAGQILKIIMRNNLNVNSIFYPKSREFFLSNYSIINITSYFDSLNTLFE
jgi:hypothetical protein